MQVQRFSGQLKTLSTQVLFVPLTEEILNDTGYARLDEVARLLKLGRKALIAWLKERKFDPSGDRELLVPLIPGKSKISAVVFLPLSLGVDRFLKQKAWLDLATRMLATCRERGFVQMAVLVAGSTKGYLDVANFAEALCSAEYVFNRYRSKPRLCKAMEEVLLIDGPALSAKDVQLGIAVANGRSLARDVILTAPNDMTPWDFAQLARTVAARSTRLQVEVFGPKDLEHMGAKAILAVGGGSVNPPYMVVLKYVPTIASTKQPLALVGKGVTYDSGGYCLKPAESQPEMTGDCGGAAAVLGAMAAIAEIGSCDRPVYAVLCLAENMISGSAFRAADVIGTLAGKTVHVLNTDAEGRLVLADGITYAARLGASEIVDVATLTGACVIALGNDCAALLSNSEQFAGKVEQAAQCATERMHQLPLLPEYRSQMRGTISDLQNMGSVARAGGTIVAAWFLAEFVPDGVAWAHLDVAGTALKGVSKGEAPGYGVSTLVQLAMMG